VFPKSLYVEMSIPKKHDWSTFSNIAHNPLLSTTKYTHMDAHFPWICLDGSAWAAV